MRIERVGENKIRIFVTYDDLEERDIDLEAFNTTLETRSFWDLMEQVRSNWALMLRNPTLY